MEIGYRTYATLLDWEVGRKVNFMGNNKLASIRDVIVWGTPLAWGWIG